MLRHHDFRRSHIPIVIAIGQQQQLIIKKYIVPDSLELHTVATQIGYQCKLNNIFEGATHGQ